MDRFEKKIKKIKSINNICYDWLISYDSESIRKSGGGF